jgi:hypothetical protein
MAPALAALHRAAAQEAGGGIGDSRAHSFEHEEGVSDQDLSATSMGADSGEAGCGSVAGVMALQAGAVQPIGAPSHCNSSRSEQGMHGGFQGNASCSFG